MLPTQSDAPRESFDARLAVVTLGIVAVIVYGSLYPFHFRDATVPGGALHTLLTRDIPTGRADDLSNFLLYLPLGLCAVNMAATKWRWPMVIAATLLGCGLSLWIETTQFYFPGRVPEFGDFEWNSMGAFVGALAGAAWKGKVRRPFALTMLACWMGNRLFPYFSRVDFQLHWSRAALAPLEVYKQTVYWLAAAVILESLVEMFPDAPWRSRVALTGTVTLVLAARLLMVAGTIGTSEIAGAIFAVIIWLALSRYPQRAAVVAVLFVALVILQALDPFHFLAKPRAFGWMPFASFVDGPRDNAVRAFFEKAFTYGTLVWLPIRAGLPGRAVIPIATAMVFGLRLIQVYLPGRSAEVTDAVMVAMLAGLMWLLRESPVPVSEQ